MTIVKEGRAVCGYNDKWVDIKSADTTQWITVSIGGISSSLTPEAAKVMARQLNTLANSMIRRRTPE